MHDVYKQDEYVYMYTCVYDIYIYIHTYIYVLPYKQV